MNISIIVLDTMRLDEFNKLVDEDSSFLEGFNIIKFNECIAPASWTLPSHASIFTGLYPSEHGAHETKEIKSLDIDRIKLRERTIVHDLKERGYHTYGISANPYIHPIYGFGGFSAYMEESYFTDMYGSVIEISGELKPLLAEYRNKYGNDVLKLSKVLLKEDPKLFFNLVLSATTLSPKAAVKKVKARLIDGWPLEKGGKNILAKAKDMRIKEPFFVFVNFMEVHDPYIGKKGLDFDWATPFLKKETGEQLIRKWRRLYKKAARMALTYGTQLMRDLLERFGDEQIIILTSDHGQAFNEHGFVGHGTVLFDETVRVPLTVVIPKWLKKNIDKEGYQSLVNIREFIHAAINGDENALAKLSSKTVYAETFSIPANILNVKNLDKKKIRKFDKYEKRTFGI